MIEPARLNSRRWHQTHRQIAWKVNEKTENIGARRRNTLERLLEEVSSALPISPPAGPRGDPHRRPTSTASRRAGEDEDLSRHIPTVAAVAIATAGSSGVACASHRQAAAKASKPVEYGPTSAAAPLNCACIHPRLRCRATVIRSADRQAERVWRIEPGQRAEADLQRRP